MAPRNRLASLAACLIFCSTPIQAAAPQACEQLPIVTADILYDRNGRPMVRTSLSGEDRYLLLDTGGAKSILHPQTVRELGLRIGQYAGIATTPYLDEVLAPPSEVYIDVTGRQSSSFAVVEDLRWGPHNFGEVEFVVAPADGSQFGGTELVGTLGADFLNDYDVTFDFDANELQLFAQNQCSASPFAQGGEADRSIAIPFSANSSNHISFPVQLDGQALTAVLDTGARDTILSMPVAQNNFSIDFNAADVVRTGELEGRYRAATYRRRFSSLSVGTLLLLDPMIFILPDMIAPTTRTPQRAGIMNPLSEARVALPELILGMSVLGNYRLHIAYDRREFFLAPAATN